MMENKLVYLDNAATSFPKAPGVAEAVYSYLVTVGSNINRGSYKQAIEAEDIVFETREHLSELFNSPKPENIVFTKNITESLNVLFKGLFKSGDHVIISSMEHNAVTRPLTHLKSKLNGDFQISILPCDNYGRMPVGSDLENLLDSYLKPNTKAIITTHASNVCGTLMPINEIGKYCRKKNIYFMIDTAQTAGAAHIDFQSLSADALAFTGHKGLLGPQGIGGIVLGDKILTELEPLITGGTGSSSEEEFQPSFMPDRFEAGTMNIPGIYGLNASLKYIRSQNIDCIRDKEMLLAERFINAIHELKKVVLIGIPGIMNRTAVISLDFPGMDNALMSHRISSVYGITNRSGLHCSPLAHKTLNTFPQGTVRFSFSHFNSLDDVDYCTRAIYECLSYFK